MTDKDAQNSYFQRGWQPKPTPPVQGGYVPVSSSVNTPPPTGGSGVKPPENKR